MWTQTPFKAWDTLETCLALGSPNKAGPSGRALSAARWKNVECWKEEERGVLWGWTLSVARMAYNRSSFMQANTLCSVIFSCQNEQIWYLRGFFFFLKDLYVCLQSQLLTLCVMRSLVAKLNEQICCSKVFSQKTSMFAYNRSSLCKHTLCSVIFSCQN